VRALSYEIEPGWWPRCSSRARSSRPRTSATGPTILQDLLARHRSAQAGRGQGGHAHPAGHHPAPRSRGPGPRARRVSRAPRSTSTSATSRSPAGAGDHPGAAPRAADRRASGRAWRALSWPTCGSSWSLARRLRGRAGPAAAAPGRCAAPGARRLGGRRDAAELEQFGRASQATPARWPPCWCCLSTQPVLAAAAVTTPARPLAPACPSPGARASTSPSSTGAGSRRRWPTADVPQLPDGPHDGRHHHRREHGRAPLDRRDGAVASAATPAGPVAGGLRPPPVRRRARGRGSLAAIPRYVDVRQTSLLAAGGPPATWAGGAGRLCPRHLPLDHRLARPDVRRGRPAAAADFPAPPGASIPSTTCFADVAELAGAQALRAAIERAHLGRGAGAAAGARPRVCSANLTGEAQVVRLPRRWRAAAAPARPDQRRARHARARGVSRRAARDRRPDADARPHELARIDVGD
jgi:hypothetical protein